MQVQNINNSNPQFRGYVDKSTIKYVWKAVKNECKYIEYKAKEEDIPIDKKQLTDIRYLGTKVLNDLSSYMKDTHPKTSFTMGDTNNISYPRFKNPITNQIIRIYTTISNISPQVDIEGDIVLPKVHFLSPKKKANYYDLKTLENLLQKLKTIDPKEIDKAFYNKETESLKISKEENGVIRGLLNAWKEFKIENFLSKLNQKS